MALMITGCPPPAEVIVGLSPATSTIEVAATVTLNATSTDATDTFSWTTSDGAIASVAANGASATITGVAEGDATITVTGTNSAKTDTATVTVLPLPYDIQAMRLDASFTDPLNPDDAGWGGRTQKDANLILETTSGSPSLGGHGATGTTGKPVQIQAAYDDTNMYMHILWPDTTDDETNRAWTFDGTAWSQAGDEDRLFVSWPIVDGPGREGKTFEEVGCTMMCHQVDLADNTRMVADTITTANDCTLCHVNVVDNHSNDNPPFQHGLLNGLDCAVCHEGTRPDVVTDGTTYNGADMIAPTGVSIDIWHWKAQRSNPIGLAEDQFTSDGTRRGRDGSNIAPNNSAATLAGAAIPKYIWVDAATHASGSTFHLIQSAIDSASAELAVWNIDTQQYEKLSDASAVVPVAGDTVSRVVLRDDLVGTDATANVLANGVYDPTSHTWAVVLKRTLASTDAAENTDVQFDVNNIIPFSIAVTDNTGIVHNGIAGPIRLGFLAQ